MMMSSPNIVGFANFNGRVANHRRGDFAPCRFVMPGERTQFSIITTELSTTKSKVDCAEAEQAGRDAELEAFQKRQIASTAESPNRNDQSGSQISQKDEQHRDHQAARPRTSSFGPCE